MALKALMLRRSIDKKKAELAALQEKDTEFEAREKELETAIGEAETDEQEQAVNDEVEKYDADKKAHDDAKAQLASEIDSLETDLAASEAAAPAPAPLESRSRMETQQEERGMHMSKINYGALPMQQRAFDALPLERRQAIVAKPEVKEFLAKFRSMVQNRGADGLDLTLPVDLLEIVSQNQYRYSKLLNRVRVRTVRGQGRQNIVGTAPEAVWTEMCGAINELSFNINQIVLDGYKVAGYIPVCNSIMELSDIDVAAMVVELLSESLGLAKDKAILYGKGSAYHMPLGIVPRLAQTAAPENYPADSPAWVDLHESNIKKIGGSGSTGAAFWSDLVMATSAVNNPYARGTKFWAMNSNTLAMLQSKVITFTGNGDIVANVFGVLPIVNGDIDILEFMPDGDIVGGYGDLYLWLQRMGMRIDRSDQVQFIQDNTVFRGKELADGAPIIPGAFVAININNQAVTTTMNFALDKANDAMLQKLTIGSENLTPAFDANTYTYSVTASAASAAIEATAAQGKATVEISYNGKNVRNGGNVTWTADGAAHPLTVTVTQGNSVRVYTINVTKASG